MPSEERNYYVICDDNCKFPSMTYEQIIEAIAEATGNVPEHVEDAFITKVKESNHNANLTFWKGTQAEFNALSVTATVYKVGIDANGKLYFTPFEADDLTAHASRHASGGEDELTAEDIGALPDYGGTMGGNIDMDGHKVIGLDMPTNASDAATKAYVDEKSEIILYAGDGFTTVEAIVQHPTNYVYLDTGETLDIDIANYAMEMEIGGYGKIGDGNTFVLNVLLWFGESDITQVMIRNSFEISEIGDVVWNFANQMCYFGEKTLTYKRASYGGGNSIQYASYIDTTGLTEKTLKRVIVVGANPNNTLLNSVIRFTRIKGRE